MHFGLSSMLLLLMVLFAARAHADQGANNLTLGLRLGAILAQGRLASPPLPSIGKDEYNHIRPQVTYITGKIKNYFGQPETANATRYTGKPDGWGVGLSYTTPSNGQVSGFAFGIYSQTQANYDLYLSGQPMPDVQVQKNNSSTEVGAIGVNYVLSGQAESFFASGLFAFGYYSRTNTSYDYNSYVDSIASTHVKSDTQEYGPAMGIQARVKWGLASVSSYILYAYDMSNRCVAFNSGGNDIPCADRMDSSFGSFGSSFGFWRFGLSIYSKLWSKIDSTDVHVKKYQLSYSVKF